MHPKEIAARSAVASVETDQLLGLGTGSTVAFALKALSERMQDEGLRITGVPTSLATEEECHRLGIPLTNLLEHNQLDIAIDGADQVDANFQVIKGYGGALLREKIVARASRAFWVIVDSSKLSDKLNIKVPVEVLPFGVGAAQNELVKLGGTPRLRENSGKVFVSDNGNHILDVAFGVIDQPKELAEELSQLPGVMDHGLFIDLATEIHVGEENQVKVLRRG